MSTTIRKMKENLDLINNRSTQMMISYPSDSHLQLVKELKNHINDRLVLPPKAMQESAGAIVVRGKTTYIGLKWHKSQTGLEVYGIPDESGSKATRQFTGPEACRVEFIRCVDYLVTRTKKVRLPPTTESE